MTQIVPAITVETPDEYKAAVEKLHPFAERVHIDIADGVFAPRFLVSAEQLYWPASWTVDVHAMVAKPSEHVATLLQLKPHSVIFHAEVEEDLLPVFNQLKQAGIQAGLALLKPTVPKTVAPLIEAADHVMVFSGELGQYGGTASLMQLEKVRLVRTVHPHVEIGWDGGASVDNVFSLSQGGIDVINVGGAINRADDPAAVYKKMVVEINKHGIL